MLRRGASTVLTINPFVRRDNVHYYPSADAFDDSPATLAQHRTLTNWGVKADIAYAHGRHNIKVGTQLMQTPLDENFSFGVLVNEAYLKLIGADRIRCEGRLQFFALCAQVIRRIVVDHARNRLYAKRGGRAVHVPIDDGIVGAPARNIDVLALDAALDSLSNVDSRKARVVELRYFGRLSVEETAEALRISPETTKRDWKMAKAWLLRELTGT